MRGELGAQADCRTRDTDNLVGAYESNELNDIHNGFTTSSATNVCRICGILVRNNNKAILHAVNSAEVVVNATNGERQCPYEYQHC